MKRKTTISPSNKSNFEINQVPFAKKFSQNTLKVSELNSNMLKGAIKIKHKTPQEQKFKNMGEQLSVLKEESEIEENKQTRYSNLII